MRNSSRWTWPKNIPPITSVYYKSKLVKEKRGRKVRRGKRGRREERIEIRSDGRKQGRREEGRREEGREERGERRGARREKKILISLFKEVEREKVLQDERIVNMVTKISASSDNGFQQFFKEYPKGRRTKRRRGKKG